MMRTSRLLPLALLLLSGCGMYGSLYLEEDAAAPEITERPPTAGEEPQEEREQREEREDDAAGDS